MQQFQNSNICKNTDCFFYCIQSYKLLKNLNHPSPYLSSPAFVHCYQHPSEQVFLVNKFFLSIFTTTHTTGKKINVCMLEWFFHLWWYYILSKPYEKYENTKKKIHPLLCQKNSPHPYLTVPISGSWLKRTRARACSAVAVSACSKVSADLRKACRSTSCYMLALTVR